MFGSSPVCVPGALQTFTVHTSCGASTADKGGTLSIQYDQSGMQEWHYVQCFR